MDKVEGPPKSDAKTTSSVKSATRVFELLGHFEKERRPLRLKEVAALTGYPMSSTAALLKAVSSLGYLNFDTASRAYFPTLALGRLANWLPEKAFEDGAVRQSMAAISKCTNECVVLASVREIHVEYVDAIRSKLDFNCWSPPGTKRLLVQSGMGWLVLGRQPRKSVENLLSRTIKSGALPQDSISFSDLLTKIDQCRTKDVLFTKPSDFTVHPGQAGTGMISAVVPTPFNYRPLLFGVSGPSDRLRANLESITRILRTEVARLEASGADRA